jgi:hypothetical protein
VQRVLSDPVEGERIAKEFGLWSIVRDTILKPLRLVLARKDVNHFLEYVIEDPETLEYAKQQSFHKEWQALITEFKRVLIVAPRGHGKSIQLITRIVWEIGKNPNIRVKIIGSSDDKAKEVLGLVKAMIKNSERVHEVFPDLRIDDELGDTKAAFFVVRSNVTMRDATCEASGVLSTGAGGRADLLVCDDVVDMKNSVINPALRDQVIRTVKETWFSLVAATGRIVWIATPYHVADATHNLRDEGASIWHIWWKPAIKYTLLWDEEGEPIMEEVLDEESGEKIIDPRTGKIKLKQAVSTEYLWPEKWNAKTLADKKIEVGPRVFARQYLLNAMSDDERTFPDANLAKSYDFTIHDIGVGIEDEWATFGGIDLASALGKKAAYTVVCTLALNPNNGRLYIKSLYRKRMGFTKTIEVIVDEFTRHKWRNAFCENNGYQKAVEDSMDENFKSIPIAGFHTSATGKADALVGLPGMSVAFSKGLFAIPAAHFPLADDDTSDLGILMQELATHPGGEFSDTVMALWFAYRAAIEGQGDYQDSYISAVEAA